MQLSKQKRYLNKEESEAFIAKYMREKYNKKIIKQRTIGDIIDKEDLYFLKEYLKNRGDPNLEFKNKENVIVTPLSYVLSKMVYKPVTVFLYETFKILLKFGADPIGKENFSYLHKIVFAVVRTQSLKIFKSLIKYDTWFYEKETNNDLDKILVGANENYPSDVFHFKILYSLFKKKPRIVKDHLDKHSLNRKYDKVIEKLKLKYNNYFYKNRGMFILLLHEKDKNNPFYKENIPKEIFKKIYFLVKY